ncbi:lasso peptide biosynthesis B2 protein [Sphingomonas humi]|uniref:Lasso peptide biosynthesis B2 protein n=1 Tax=Sphingomonas humi TaxID=335630 RepID=A0ABP7SDI8_9SPHN
MKLPPPRHWGTIVEAGAALAAAGVVTRLLPFDRYICMGARAVSRRAQSSDGMTESWIVDALANRAPFRAVCLQRGLALQWMLRRRGVDAVLHYGVQLDKSQPDLSAHVWVSAAGQVLIGAPQHEEFTEVARYPAPVK